MSASTAMATRSWAVGKRTVTMTMPKMKVGKAAHISIEWAPDEPQGLTAEEMAQYRAGRDAALIEVAQVMGGSVAVIEL